MKQTLTFLLLPCLPKLHVRLSLEYCSHIWMILHTICTFLNVFREEPSGVPTIQFSPPNSHLQTIGVPLEAYVLLIFSSDKPWAQTVHIVSLWVSITVNVPIFLLFLYTSRPKNYLSRDAFRSSPNLHSMKFLFNKLPLNFLDAHTGPKQLGQSLTV